MVNQEKSIFKALYQQRFNNVVEEQVEESKEPVEKVEEQVEEQVIEEQQEETTETNESTEVVEEQVVEEEVTVLACPECGSMYESSELTEGTHICPECNESELEERVKLVVRDGKVVKKQVKTKKTRMTSAQKQALAKARKKAHTTAANKARKKSLKVRNRRIAEEETLECPVCEGSFPESEFEKKEGFLVCPECGAELELVEEGETSEEVEEACAKKEEACKDKEEACKSKEEEACKDKEEACKSKNESEELPESLLTVLKALKVEEELKEQIDNKDLNSIKSYLQEKFFIEIK